MKILSIILFSLLILIQYPLWFGKGSWYDVFKLKQEFNQQYKINSELSKENFALKAEVSDLTNGSDAIEGEQGTNWAWSRKTNSFFRY